MKTNKGFSMIELLVAMVILAIGLLGMAGLQNRSIQMNQSAYMSSQASYLASDMMDRIRANRSGSYNLALGDDAPAGTSLAARDLQEWLLAMRGDDDAPGLLTQDGDKTGGSISVSGGIATVRVVWVDARWETEDDDRIRTYEIQAQL